ncbi:transposase [Ancylostoma caninum]|uniref:Transposase n=1 Tax=Ancylostoma caninum TaxID=29170 RepID=A0A368HA17_ANCCA|nr:transposase [Ancylostoma caninum]
MARPRGAKNLTKLEQRAIVEGHRQGRKHHELASQFHVSRQTISNFLKHWKTNGGREHKKRVGRPRITTSVIDRNIVRVSRSNPRLTATEIAREIAYPEGQNPSVRTVRRRLQAFGLEARRPVKKPFISIKNRKARVAWARAHLHWQRKEWSEVLWSDESKYMLFGSDGIKWIRRPDSKRYDPKYLPPTVKHGGGSCPVWGCFSARGMGPLHHIQGTMDRHVYKDILENVMLPYARQSLQPGFIYQEDNDSKHRSKDVQA